MDHRDSLKGRPGKIITKHGDIMGRRTMRTRRRRRQKGATDSGEHNGGGGKISRI